MKPFNMFGQIAVSGNLVEKLLDCHVTVDPVFVSFGQHAVHSLHKTIQAWQQVG